VLAACGSVPPTTITDCSDPDDIASRFESGGTFDFDCGEVEIVFTNTIDIGPSTSTTIRGGNEVTLSGGYTTQIFAVASTGFLRLEDITLTDGYANTGGAIFNNGGTLNIVNSTLTDNEAYYGGALANMGGTVTIERSTFSGNSATDDGGAIGNTILPAASITIITSTFSGNSAGDVGGAIYNAVGTIQMSSSTFAQNSAGTSGGAIYNQTGAVLLVNTILADSPSGGNCSSGTPLASSGHNLNTDGSCTGWVGTDLPNVPAGLDPLMDNGGPTETHNLQPGSAAIDSGDCAGTFTDQRFLPRPVDGNNDGSAICDRGAVEVQLALTFSSGLKPFPELNRAVAGDPLYVRFSLGGNKGSNVFFPGFPQTAEIACGSSVEHFEGQPASLARAPRYYSGQGGYYQFVMRTDHDWGDSCRQVIIRLSDGSTYQVNFQFRRGDSGG
jgi:predicted outer membrane repeat protein